MTAPRRHSTATLHATALLAPMLALPALLAACAGGGGSSAGAAPPPPPAPASRGAHATPDAAQASALVPPGYGTLRQDDIAVQLRLTGVLVKAMPLDEGVIRLLSPDSYRALRDLQESRRAQVTALARRFGLQQVRLWYVSYYGLAPEARFSPNELSLTSAGRDFRPLDVLPVTAGFGENRLRQRETQTALYLFDGALDVSQPLTVRVESVSDPDAWSMALRRIERERALVRSRAAASAAAPARP
ncbi:MAG: hypothetical protein ACJ79S_12250 [Gemmatimonadaceae bacterium]